MTDTSSQANDASTSLTSQEILLRVALGMLAALGLCLAAGWVIEFYFGHAVIENLSFHSSDYSYVPFDTSYTPALGVHYFGDFELVVGFGQSHFSPYAPDMLPQAYGPPVYVLGKVFGIFASWPGAVFLFLPLATIMFFVGVTKLLGPSTNALLIATLCILTGPVVMSLDRGNVEILLAGCFAFFAYGHLSDRRWATVIALAFAIAMKPYVVILLIVLVRARRWRDACLTVILTAGLYVTGFFLVGGDLVSSIVRFVRANLSFAGTNTAGVDNHFLLTAVSATGAVYRTYQLIEGSGAVQTLLNSHSSAYTQLPGIVALLLCGAIVVLASRERVGEQSQREFVLIAALAMTQLVPAATAGYTQVAMVVEMCVLVRRLSRISSARPWFGPMGVRATAACIVLLVIGDAPSMGYAVTSGPGVGAFDQWYLQVLNFMFLGPILDVIAVMVIVASLMWQRLHPERRSAEIPPLLPRPV